MQLHALYESKWAEDTVVTNAVICTTSFRILSIQTSEYGSNFEHHISDSVQVQHDGRFHSFECSDGDFTNNGRNEFIQAFNEFTGSLKQETVRPVVKEAIVALDCNGKITDVVIINVGDDVIAKLWEMISQRTSNGGSYTHDDIQKIYENGSEHCGGGSIEIYSAADIASLYECQNCSVMANHSDLTPISDASHRFASGDTFTDVECTACGSPCYPIETD